MNTDFLTIHFLVLLGYVWGQAPTCPENAPGVVFFPDPEDCSKYYECYSGIRSHMSCPEHLYWNVNQNACDYFPNVNCGDRPVLTTANPSTTVNPSTTAIPTTSTASSPTTPNYDPDPTCPPTTENITFYPDPTDCKKYFQCNRGERFNMTCPANLLYNVNEKACDYPEHVDCSGRSTPVHTTATSPSTTTTSTTPTTTTTRTTTTTPTTTTTRTTTTTPTTRTTTTTPTTTIPTTTTTQSTTSTTSSPTTPNYDPDPKCPATTENITFYPDPSDCKKYFECNRGERFDMVCPGDLLYNVNEQACDFPEHVNCAGRSTPVHTTPTTTPASTTPSYDPNPKCPTSSSVNITFFPDPSDCRNYFLCNRGDKFNMTCPEELLWNVNEDACDYPEYVSCSGRSTPVYTTTTPSGPTSPTAPTSTPNPIPQCPNTDKNITFISDPSDCKKFFMCNRGTRFSMTCPGGLLYNPIVQACDIPSETDCTGRNPYHPCKGKEDGEYAGDPRDCKIFYECEYQSGIARYCRDNLYWCQEEYTCDVLNKPGCTCYKY